jgi:hypothetical protein
MGSTWMQSGQAPFGLHAAWNWDEALVFGVPTCCLVGPSSLFHGSFAGPAWATGMPSGVEAGWPNGVLFSIWWFIFARWLPEVKYPRQIKSAPS